MNAFATDQELFQTFGAERREPKGCAILGKANSMYAPHVYRGGSVIPGWGYSVERIVRGFVTPQTAGNPAQVAHVG